MTFSLTFGEGWHSTGGNATTRGDVHCLAVIAASDIMRVILRAAAEERHAYGEASGIGENETERVIWTVHPKGFNLRMLDLEMRFVLVAQTLSKGMRFGMLPPQLLGEVRSCFLRQWARESCSHAVVSQIKRALDSIVWTTTCPSSFFDDLEPDVYFSIPDVPMVCMPVDPHLEVKPEDWKKACTMRLYFEHLENKKAQTEVKYLLISSSSEDRSICETPGIPTSVHVDTFDTQGSQSNDKTRSTNEPSSRKVAILNPTQSSQIPVHIRSDARAIESQLQGKSKTRGLRKSIKGVFKKLA